MKKATALLLTILLLALSACGSARSSQDGMTASANGSTGEAGEPEEMYNSQAGGGFDDGRPDLAVPESETFSDPDAKIIRTAELTIQTIEFDQSVSSLAELTEANGGYYETAQVNSGGYYDRYARRSAYYVVRIPRENFLAFRESVGDVATYTALLRTRRMWGRSTTTPKPDWRP